MANDTSCSRSCVMRKKPPQISNECTHCSLYSYGSWAVSVSVHMHPQTEKARMQGMAEMLDFILFIFISDFSAQTLPCKQAARLLRKGAISTSPLPLLRPHHTPLFLFHGASAWGTGFDAMRPWQGEITGKHLCLITHYFQYVPLCFYNQWNNMVVDRAISTSVFLLEKRTNGKANTEYLQ